MEASVTSSPSPRGPLRSNRAPSRTAAGRGSIAASRRSAGPVNCFAGVAPFTQPLPRPPSYNIHQRFTSWRRGAGTADMASRAEETRLARSGRDDAADASRFFARVGYAALAIGAPVAVVVHPLALFIVFPDRRRHDRAGRGARGQAGIRGRARVGPSPPRRSSPSSPASAGRRCRSCGRPTPSRRCSTP